MKYLKSELEFYFGNEYPKTKNVLPSDSEIVKALSAKAFEVEEVSKVEVEEGLKKYFDSNDSIIDIKVLPNRAHDALCYSAMALELAKCLDMEGDLSTNAYNYMRPFEPTADEYIVKSNRANNLSVIVEDSKACSRFIATRIDNIKVIEGNNFLSHKLSAIGQKSINNIVDLTNHVMYHTNKPLHAYDADVIKGAIVVRYAREGETLITLDDKELKLDTDTLVIADDEKVLGLAGIKGGKYSGVSEATTSVILESANFNPSLIRRTAQKYGYRTDASKRFENGLADELCEVGTNYFCNSLLAIHNGGDSAKFGLGGDLIIHKSIESDIYKPKTKYICSISMDEVNSKLGASLSESQLNNYLYKVALGISSSSVVEYQSARELLLKQIAIVASSESSYVNPSNMRQDAPKAFSCSSLISYLYAGVYMPSISIDKYLYTRDLAKDIKTSDDLKFGDLIYSNTGEGKIRTESVEYMSGTIVEQGIDHVAFYLGEWNGVPNMVIHSTKVANGIVIETLEEHLATRKLSGYGRVLENLDEKRFYVVAPCERLDIRIKEDLIEEVARYYGLDNIASTLPKLNITTSGSMHKRMYWENVIKKALLSHGYSEVYTYSFANKGDVEILKPISKDKSKLRTNLSDGLAIAMQSNLQNMPILDQKDIRIFEFGNCFKASSDGSVFEWRSLVIGIDDGKKKSNFISIADNMMLDMAKSLDIDLEDLNELVFKRSDKPIIYEIDFDKLIESLPTPDVNCILSSANSGKYKTFSLMPFIVRDIAVWVDSSVSADSILEVISQLKGDLCNSVKLFDEFSKDGKTSYAFRMIFQSIDRTLTDREVAEYVDPIYEALKSNGWEVR